MDHRLHPVSKPDTSGQSTRAVNDGSGVYAGARGTAVLRQVSGKRTAVTISLV